MQKYASSRNGTKIIKQIHKVLDIFNWCLKKTELFVELFDSQINVFMLF